MMLNKATILAVGATLVDLASAVGKARVVNNCPFNVSLWSVGSVISSATTLIPGTAYNSYGEPFTRDPVTGGRAIKITLQPNGLFNGDAQTIYAYNLQGNTVWYDLSDVFGDAFGGHKVALASANPNCPQIVWGNGIPPAGSQVKSCGADQDVTLTLCA